jgi:outer membrane receptor protein involved in Fe transport
MKFNKLLLILISCISPLYFYGQNSLVKISGIVTDSESKRIEFASVGLEGTNYSSITNEQGEYEIHAPEGSYNLMMTAVGYKAIVKTVSLKTGFEQILNIKTESSLNTLNEIIVTGKSNVQMINQSAYNVVAVNTKPLHNTTLDLSHALDRISGVRIRETGGVGSSSTFSLNGFSGRQVRFFIDGVPMENFGSSFQINNIPINLAERIEVYKGVVPISFGADALGGAVNIVTTKQAGTFLDASYSYGSFNTHKSYINLGHTFKSGFIVQLNAYQNYSDNNYKITTDIIDFNTGKHSEDIKVKRFHDNYHNETVIANIGVVGKKYADRLLVGIILGKNKSDIQTGARMREVVYGDRFRRGNTIMPTLQYSKRDILIKNLDVSLTGNFNFGYEQVIDTVARRYNWLGEYEEKPRPGSEQSRTMAKNKDNLGIFTGNVNYRIKEKHTITVNNVFNSFNRKIKNEIDPTNNSYSQPRITKKNIIGIGYKFDYNDAWSSSIFVKQFHQKTSFSETSTGSGGWGTTEYTPVHKYHNAWGYGIASAYFVIEDLQLKASYEKSLRMPGNTELFGEEGENLEGNSTLKPESSHNFNLGATFSTKFNDIHGLIVDGAFLYRDTRDFIRAKLNTNGTHTVMENQDKVKNTGFNGELRYSFKNLLTANLNMTYQNIRNNTKYVTSSDGVQKESGTYKDRMPNIPYIFGNFDCGLFLHDLIKKGNSLTFNYNILYVHEYYLRWPSEGQSTTKKNIPTQVSHDISTSYTMKNGMYNVSLECRNILDEDIFDNFSLQKPGRSFSIKFRYFFNKY